MVRLEEKAGIVPLDVLVDSAGKPTGAMLTAPEPFSVPIAALPVEHVAACVGLEPGEMEQANHPPLVATTGLPFIVAEVGTVEALSRSRGMPSAFGVARAAGGPLADAPAKVLLYARVGAEASAMPGRSHRIRARMHRADGTEDAGTGSANACLVGLRMTASLEQAHSPSKHAIPSQVPAILAAAVASLAPTAGIVTADVLQGVEMGRPSELQAEAERLAVGRGGSEAAVGAVRIGGSCAAIGRGVLVGWD